MRSRRRTHHSHVAWSGSDEEFQSQTPQPAWDAAWDRVRAERKQAGLPNTYTHQTANLCSKLNCASLPRPQGRAGALNLGDDSGRHEDPGTTESTEITERRIRRRETRPSRMRLTSAT